MTSLALGSRARALVAVVLTALLVLTGLTVGALPARAATGDVAGATLNWGLKESFRNYIAGPIAHGSWALSGGVTDSPAFSWSGGAGGYDAGLGTGTVSYPGAIRFTGHETPAGSGNFLLDVTIANVRIAKTGATTAQLIVDGASSGTSSPNAVFAEVNLGAASASTDGATVSYTAAPAALTAVGSQIMQGFYPAGQALDPVSFSWPVEQAAAPTTASLAILPAAGAEVGATVTLTATVTPADAPGTVQFRDGSTALGEPVTVSAGTATLSTTALAVGDHSITAEFVPSAGHAASASTAVTYSIVAAPLASGVAWGLSSYLNSANVGRPNPSPANYGAPASFDATSRISTWGERSVTSNPDGTVTLAFAGSTVNHAKTGGGWLRLADLEATLDKSGNGVVSAVVSYGTMSPPAVFDPTTAPVRGPERVDLVVLSGNAVAPTTVPGGATWGGLGGVWSPEFLAFLAGDGTATPAWAYASTVTNSGAADRKPSTFAFTLDSLPTFVDYANEAQWGISGYLNSANVGRPNPSPANYGAPSTFDATSRISTWGAGTVTSNDDRTVTLAFDGSSVNHAKTGGGWLRIADLEATLDETGNGVVSGVVSYGTMSPPAVFNPATPPVRGPERVDLVTLAGNDSVPVVNPAGAKWVGLDGTWNPEFLAFLGGDTAATPAIPGWAYASTVTNTGAVDRMPSTFTFTLDQAPVFTGEPGGPEDPGTGPEDPPVVIGPAATPGTLRWGVKSQFRDYVLGPIAHGSISTAGGAGTSGSEFTFPQSASAIDSASGLGTASFRGNVRFTGHAGALSVLVGDPVVRLTSATSGMLSVATATGRVDFATLALGSATRTVDATGAISYTGIPATLTAAGASGFAGFYNAGDALAPVSFTVGADNPTNGRGSILQSTGSQTPNSPDATPPATEGIDFEGDPVEGGEFTASADGFQPNETGILVVIYSDPIVLADNATADASGVVTWSGRLPAGLTGSHTLTFQGSVDRGVVLDIAAAEQVGCPIESATLSWGLKESFRAYITGLAAGEWTTSDGAGYETPEFVWTQTGGAWDGQANDGQGSGGLEFAGAVRFTGHEGALDTTIANPRLVLDGDRGALFLDISGTTQDGRPITAQGIEFADLELASAQHERDGDSVVISGIPATLTAAGAAAFGTYPAGEALDPVSVAIVGGACAEPLAAAAAELPTPELAASASPLGWWLLAVAVLLAILATVIVLVVRRRSAVRAG